MKVGSELNTLSGKRKSGHARTAEETTGRMRTKRNHPTMKNLDSRKDPQMGRKNLQTVENVEKIVADRLV